MPAGFATLGNLTARTSPVIWAFLVVVHVLLVISRALRIQDSAWSEDEMTS